MAREAKLRGYDPSGLIGLGGAGLVVSSVLVWGRSESAFLIEEYRVTGAIIPGLILLLAAVIAMLGKRFGSRPAMIGGALIALGLGALSVWARFGNLSEIRDAGVDLEPGFWAGMGGSVLATLGGLLGVILGLVLPRAEPATAVVPPATAVVPPATPVAAVVPPAPSAVPVPGPGPGWIATHHVPAPGMPACALPDPASEVIAMLEPGLGLQLLERRADWAHVRAITGWEGWVDARKLVAAGQPVG